VFELSNLQAWLSDAQQRHNVVGASLAIFANDREHTAASGALNLDTQIDVTTDSAFQIGSITKVFTTTLLMQLVDESLLDIELPVIHYLPDFALLDSDATAKITVKQLMNHSSGIDGEFQVQWNPDDNSIAGFVAQLKDAPMISPPGYMMTYCNVGWVVLGRIIEVLRSGRFPEIVMQYICAPLGMQQAFCRPQDSLKFRCAMGHERGLLQNEPPRVAGAAYLPLHSAPTGSVLSMSAPDLLEFGKAQFRMTNGSPLLSDRSRLAMQTPTIALPPLQRIGFTHMGLGWSMGVHDDYTVLAHDGGTLGQYAYLRVFPRQGVCVALLTNSISMALYAELDTHIMRDLIGVEAPVQRESEPFSLLADRYAGIYANGSMRLQVSQKDNAITIALVDAANTALLPAADATPYRDEYFRLAVPIPLLGDTLGFHDSASNGQAQYLRIASRMLKRVQ
jgi:CubicO group peptidase (beta-lactamase class C family)